MFWLSSKKERNQTIEITVASPTVIRVLILVIVSFLLLAALRKASHALLLIFTAFFLSLALNTPVHWLATKLPGKSRGSRSLATALSFLVVVVFLVGFLASIVPPLVRQTSSFIDAAPHLVEDVRNEDSSLGRIVRRYHLQDQVDSFSSQLNDRLKNVTTTAVSTFSRVTSSIFSMLTVLVLTFMLLIEGPLWLKRIAELIPDEKRSHAEQLAEDMYHVVRGYANGQVILAALASVMILIPLLILGVSYPIALMVVVFICGLIPLVGHTIGAIIVSTVALFHSPATALIILLYYITYQQIENYIVQPRIQANTTDLSPLLVFGSVIIGVSFNGLFGGLMAIPIAGCLRVLIVDYLKHRHLFKGPRTETE